MLSVRRHSLIAVALATIASGVVAPVVTAPSASATTRLTQQPGFSARAWTVTSPDSTGTRYVGGDFTSYQAWETGFGAAVDPTSGEVDPSFPKVTGWPYADVVVSDGSGGWFIGGGISTVDGTSVARVAHLNADGSLDTSWTPNVVGGQGVFAMAKSGDTLLIGGSFTEVDGQPRSRLAALDATTGVLLDWAPAADSTVHDITVRDDTAYIGGQFTTLAGQTRNLAAAIRLDARTTAAGTCLDTWDNTDCLTAWDPNVGGWGVLTIETDGTDAWLGGAFTSIGGLARGSLGKVDATTGAVDAWNPSMNNQVEALLLDGATLYVGGNFTSASGSTRNKLAAYDTTTDSLTAWDPNVSGNSVKSIAKVGSTLYVVGRFDFIGGVARNHAGAVDTSGVVQAWDPHVCDQSNGAESTVYGVAATATSAYLIGDFPCMGGLKRMHAAAVGANGVLTDWAPAVSGPVFSFSRSGDVVYMSGNFTNVNGATRRYAAAVHADGTLQAWDPDINSSADVIATPSKVYLGGFFTTVGGVARRGLAVVDPTTAVLDTSFNADLDSNVRAMWLEGSRLFIGGDFTTSGGNPHEYVAVVDAATGLAELGFTASTGVGSATWPFVEAIAVIGDRVYLGGSFGTVNGNVSRGLGVVNATTGATDPSWAGSADRDVYALAPSTDDSLIYVGGNVTNFTSGSGTAVGVAAFDAVTGELAPWRADTGLVYGISTSDAAVFLAGSFNSVGGQPRQNSAAVDLDGNVLSPWPMNTATSTSLTVTITGDASGAIVSAPGGINCGDACAYAYDTGSSVTLTAVPDPGATFDGWTGDCSGSATTCTVSVATARTATARFVGPGGGGGGGGTTPVAPPVTYPPSAPVAVTAEPVDAAAIVTWQAPVSSGSFPVTNYRVTADPGGHTCLTTQTTCALTGLTNGVEYVITVEALNGAGWGAASGPISVTPTPAQAPTITITALPRTGEGRYDRIRVTGIAVDLLGDAVLRPYLSVAGRDARALGKARVRVASDGTFTWKRKVRPEKAITVYFEADGVSSNSVSWPASRR